MYPKKKDMNDCELARALILQMIRTRMSFRQALQGILKRNNLDVTFEMLQVMSCLWREQGVSQQILAEKTAKDKACLTSLMNNLEKKGWVIRRQDPQDKRNRLVFLTPAGEEMSERIRPLIVHLYAQAGEALGQETLLLCINQLKRLDEILNQL